MLFLDVFLMFLHQYLVHLVVVLAVFVGQVVTRVTFADVVHKLAHQHLPLIEMD